MNRRYYDNTLEDQQLAEIAEKARIRAGQKDSRVEGYRPGAVKGFKTSKELSDEELEGLDVFDPDNPPKAEPRPLPEGIIYDSGWQEPANGRRKGWVNSPIDAPLAPGLRAKQRGFEESDLPDVVPPGEGDPNFRGPPRPAPGADGEPTFKDKPDGEQYLTKEQKQAAKAPLYAYLQDKMARRQRATSGAAYDSIEKGIMGQRARADSGALLGALSQGASMMGTLGGKRAESTIVPTITKNLNDSTQAAFDNWRGMRGIEEASNANDLNVAKYISGLDQYDEDKKLKILELYDRAAARRLRGNPSGEPSRQPSQEPSDAQWKRAFAERQQAERERVNRAREEREKGRGGPQAPKAPAGSDPKIDKNDIDGKTRLKPGEMPRISDGRDAFAQMEQIEKLLPTLRSQMGPVQGRAGGLNPYNARAQNAQSSLKVAAQIIGKYLEGGKLMKEDEAKYAKMLPNLNDTPATAKYKAAQIRKMLKDRYAGDLKALEAQGYSTKGYEAPADPVDTTADGPADVPQNGLKDPEEMTDAERKEELEKLRKAAGG